MVHYRPHGTLDHHHAELFFQIVHPHWKDDKHRNDIQDGLFRGHSAFFNYTVTCIGI